jgi:hypothetical protein
MAFDFDDTQTLPRMAFGQVRFASESAVTMSDGLRTMADCADLVLAAARGQEIGLAPWVKGRMLEMMGVLLLRASQLPEERREAMFRVWAERGPVMATELIDRAKEREGKMVAPEDLAAMWMGCPDGPEI